LDRIHGRRRRYRPDSHFQRIAGSSDQRSREPDSPSIFTIVAKVTLGKFETLPTSFRRRYLEARLP
jgi:hypothetical protein